MHDEERTITLSHHAKTSIYLVHLGFQHSRNCVREYRYFSRMACDLAPLCNFLYGFFQCQLPEDTIDVEIIVKTMKGIHTFKKPWQPDIIMQPMEFASPPISIPGKEDGSIFSGKKKYHRPFPSVLHLPL